MYYNFVCIHQTLKVTPAMAYRGRARSLRLPWPWHLRGGGGAGDSEEASHAGGASRGNASGIDGVDAGGDGAGGATEAEGVGSNHRRPAIETEIARAAEGKRQKVS